MTQGQPQSLLLILKVNKRWRADLSPEEVYEVTRKWWKTTRTQAERAHRVLAVAYGTVVEVFDPDR